LFNKRWNAADGNSGECSLLGHKVLERGGNFRLQILDGDDDCAALAVSELGGLEERRQVMYGAVVIPLRTDEIN
jgi:hypothetical protein